MKNTEQNNLPFYRYNPWDDANYILSLWDNAPLPAECFFSTDMVPERTPDKYFDFVFDLMLEAESSLREILGLLVEFKQRDKLMQFLLFFCDFVEFTWDKNTDSLNECRFQIDLSDGVSVLYSTRLCGCILLLDGTQQRFHDISPIAINDLRQLLAEIWGQMREFPIWEIKEENDNLVTFRWQFGR